MAYRGPAPKTPAKKDSNKTTLIRTLQNGRLRQMEQELAKEAVVNIAETDLKKAELAGQMLVGSFTPDSTLNRNKAVTNHKDFKSIETELILTRGADMEGICRKWAIVTETGELAVIQLTRHYGHMRRRFSKLFDTLDTASKEKMASSYISKADEIYNLAKNAHNKAMSQQEKTDYGLMDNPAYGPAAEMLEKMIAANNLIGAVMERQDKMKIVEQGNTSVNSPMQFNGPIGKIQVLGMPKAIQPKENKDNSQQKALPQAIDV